MGKNSYYETVTDENDRFCEDCKAKYVVKDQKYAPCQKCEVLPLGQSLRATGKSHLINLTQSISTLWLIDPFVNYLEIGDVVNMTAYYFMTPH
jgi:hypothetical protein